MSVPIFALGLDVGSTTTKLVGVDIHGGLSWHILENANPRVGEQVARILGLARQVGGAMDELTLVATGYGRKLVHQATRQVTEITCHAAGIYRQLGHGGTLVDIGGQDSKVILISPQGEVVDFAMSDKCAAGTGRFLEYTAGRLEVSLDDMGCQALDSPEEAEISSTCTVFAESEVISLIAQGIAVESILRGLHRSLVRRVATLVRSVRVTPPVMLSGGVAQNPAIHRMLEEELGAQVILPPHPQLMGAYGAALIAARMEE
jgi:predicted CoA-substrate-specific enzyme activase